MLHLNCRRGMVNIRKWHETDKHSFVGQENVKIIREVCARGAPTLIVSIPCYLTATFCPPTICPHLGQMPNSVFRAAKHEVFVEEKNASGKFSLGNYEAVSLNNSAH